MSGFKWGHLNGHVFLLLQRLRLVLVQELFLQLLLLLQLGLRGPPHRLLLVSHCGSIRDLSLAQVCGNWAA